MTTQTQFTPRPIGAEHESPSHEGNWLWIRSYWTDKGQVKMACIAQVKMIDGKLWVNTGDCRSAGNLYEPVHLYRFGWFSISQFDELSEYARSNALWQSMCEDLTAERRELSEQNTSLYAALQAVLADAQSMGPGQYCVSDAVLKEAKNALAMGSGGLSSFTPR